MGRGHDGKGGLAHSEGVCEDHWCRQISAARSASDLCSALPCFGRGSWSRSNFFWGTSQFKLPNGTLGASNGFDQKSMRSEEHTSELQSRLHLVCRLLLEKK